MLFGRLSQEKVSHKAHQQEEIQILLPMRSSAAISQKPATDFRGVRVKQHAAMKKKAHIACAGNGRRPQPRFLRRRFRFCPAAIRKASQLTRQSLRKRKRRMPCQSLASANKGSTHTWRLRMDF